MKKLILVAAMVVVLVALLGFSGVANATLWDRGGGMIYDDVLKITWLQDANYAKTSGYSTSGVFMGMTAKGGLSNAETWADNLVYGGYDDWRLPKALPVNGLAYNYSRLNDGSTDNSVNISAPDSAYPYSTASELAFMFYINLGNKGAADVHGNPQSDCGFTNTLFFINIQNSPLGDTYWVDTLTSPGSRYAGFFDSYYGYQSLNNTAHKSGYAWAVRDGDVAAVPEPGTMLLLGLGLMGVVGIKKRMS